MTYDLAEDGTLTELPMRNIDTGMGLDRMAAILQDVPSVFETDLLRPLIDLAEELSGRWLRGGRRGDPGDADRRRPLARRGLPDRRRRRPLERGPRLHPAPDHAAGDPAGQHARARVALAGRFAERTIELMGDAYPELVAERETIARWVDDEEESFGRTLERGTELLEQLIAEAKEAGTSWIDAADAFKLHDTYGFPYDLTKELLAEEGLSVDDGGFEELMEEQRQRARVGAATAHGSEDRHEKVIAFAAAAPPTEFVGYETLRATTGLAAVEPETAARWSSSRRAPSTPRAAARSPTPASCAGTGGEAEVVDVYRVGEDQALEVEPDGGDRGRRRGRGRGRPRGAPRDDAQPHRHPPPARGAARAARRPTCARPARRSAPTSCASTSPTARRSAPRSCEAIEDRVNEWIKESRPVRWLEMERAEAEKLGAMALFGEKYGEWVRVVEVDGVSRELCGGTHVANTAEVGIFKIASEGSSAANVRRIEALTGPAAIDWFREREQRLREVGELLGSPQDPLAGARRAAERLPRPARAPSRRRSSCSARRRSAWPPRRTDVGGSEAWSPRGRRSPTRSSCSTWPTGCSRSSAASRRSSSAAPRATRSASSSWSPRTRSSRGLSAAAIVREAAPVVGGGGGGRDEMAQAGGKDAVQARRGAGGGAGGDRAGARLSAMRVLALDHGTARIGCALSDPSGTLATPLPVIEPPEPRAVAELVAEHGVERVVVGLPLHLSGEEGARRHWPAPSAANSRRCSTSRWRPTTSG